MIDTNKLRQLAQGVNEHSDDRAEILAEFYAATQSDTIIELLDRLEAAEKSDAESLMMYRKARDERDALRAKIEQMERQEPVGKFTQHPSNGLWEQDGYGDNPEASPLYALPGAQDVPKEAIAKILTAVMDLAVSNGADSRSMPDEYVEVAAWLCGIPAQNVPSEQDTSVRKAWARFSNELHRSPDAPYPGMSEAFEQHFSQPFTDRDWRVESGIWAAAWKAAKHHGAKGE